MKDTLFLLTAGFKDGEGAPYYCPACTVFEGLFALYPNLGSAIEVRRVAFARPRPEIVELLGEENQSCPVLLLGAPVQDGNPAIKRAGDRQFINDPHEIGNYLSALHGIPRPH